MNKATQHSRYATLPKTRGQIFIFFMVFMNAGIFASTSSNPFGVKGASELVVLISTLFSFYYLWHQISRKGAVSKIDFTVFSLIWSAFLYSALAAQIRFGQPFVYGLIEERRILYFMIYFPLTWGIRQRVISIEQLFDWIIATALICGMLSILVYLGAITPLNIREIGANSIRGDRFGIGSAYIALASLILLFEITKYKRWLLLPQLLLLVAVLVMVIQTRQILIALLISSVILLGTIRFAIWSAFATGMFAMTVANSSVAYNLFVKYQTLLLQLSSTEYLEASARALTTNSIVGEISKGAWFGSGALSYLWNGGFARLYGENFFLTDVGIVGSAYKFGVMTLIFYGVYFVTQYKMVRAAKNHSYFRLIVGIWTYLIVILPVAATLEYRGSIAGLLLALSMGCSNESKRKTL